MFEALSHFQLQQYWWFLMSLVGSVLVFLLFVQGGQTLIHIVGKKSVEQTMIINAIGRKWEYTFTTLVVFAAGNFAAFPLFYSTTFGGAYLVWKLFLVSFVLQSIAFEFRRKRGNLYGAKTYETFLYINGFLGTFILGAAVATFFTGSAFERNSLNLSTWQSSLYGLEVLFNFTNVALGLAVMFLSRVLGAMYLINIIDNHDIRDRARKQVLYNFIPFLVFFLYFMVKVFTMEGYAYDSVTKSVYMDEFKYLKNYIEMPFALFLLISGVILVLVGVFRSIKKKSRKAIWFTAIGTILTVLSLFWVVGYNNTCFYPSYYNLQSSLTIENASASKYTLTAMSYISLFLPIVIFYMIYAWRSIDFKKITVDDVSDNSSHHVY